MIELVGGEKLAILVVLIQITSATLLDAFSNLFSSGLIRYGLHLHQCVNQFRRRSLLYFLLVTPASIKPETLIFRPS